MGALKHKPLVIYTTDEGQLAHKIYRFSEMAALARECNFPLMHGPFGFNHYGDYAQHFRHFRDQPIPTFSPMATYLEHQQVRNFLFCFARVCNENLNQGSSAPKDFLQIFQNEGPKAFLDSLPIPESRRLFRLFTELLAAEVKSNPAAFSAFHVIDGTRNGNPKLVNEINQVNYNSKEFLAELDRDAVVLLVGDEFRDLPSCNLFRRDLSLLRQLFLPNEELVLLGKQIVDIVRPHCDIAVGVHIRWGDHATWAGGKYYYSADTYRNLMRQVIHLFPTKRVAFVVVSNEKLDLQIFENIPVQLGSGHFVADLCSLAECDYIIGPVSGFNTWASIQGQKPICVVEDPTLPIELGMFKESNYFFSGPSGFSNLDGQSAGSMP